MTRKLRSALSAFSSSVEVLNSKIFGPSVPTMGGGLRVTLKQLILSTDSYQNKSISFS